MRKADPSAAWPTFAQRERKKKSAIPVGMTIGQTVKSGPSRHHIRDAENAHHTPALRPVFVLLHAKSNHSPTSAAFARKSNYSRTYAKTGGWGRFFACFTSVTSFASITSFPSVTRHELQSFPHPWQLLPHESYPLQHLPLHYVSMSARRHFHSCGGQQTAQEPVFPVRNRDAHTAKDRPLHKKECGPPPRPGRGRRQAGPTTAREPRSTDKSVCATGKLEDIGRCVKLWIADAKSATAETWNFGLCATRSREPRQARKGATVPGKPSVPRMSRSSSL